jgi:hypothetical protein
MMWPGMDRTLGGCNSVHAWMIDFATLCRHLGSRLTLYGIVQLDMFNYAQGGISKV